MKKIRKDDEVIIIAGNDKGKTGKVLQIIKGKNSDKVLVSGVNIVKKHTKPNPNKQIIGGIVDKTMPIHISNVAILNPETKKGDRVGFKVEDNKMVRIMKSTGNIIA